MNRTNSILACLFFAVAACGGGKKSVDKPVPDPDVKPNAALACDVEIALACDTESHDGCIDGRTSFHACVRDGETAGPPCAQEIAKVCPAGQIDACLTTPQLAANHLCVYDPAPPQAAEPSCPAGQGYFAPGCDGNPIPSEGCYAGCEAEACGDGFECKTVSTDPCFNDVCDACGQQQKLCVPSA